MSAPASGAGGVDLRRVFRLWFPLALSWGLMGCESPLFTMFVARMAEQEVQLAAWGSVVFPVALVVEGPIIMLLAASTALCVDGEAYRKVRRFMLWSSGLLTALHAAIAFTPLYYWVASGLIGAPDEVLEPGRLGLKIMLPWTAAIAYRRFQQGVLIRFERSRLVALGTAVRMLTVVGFLAGGRALEIGPGIVVGSLAIAAGVTAEAVFAGLCVRPVLRERVFPAAPSDEPLTRGSFLRFYLPLAMTPLLTLLIQPAGSAAMSRMPEALPSLAVWSSVHGLVFLLRSTGFAYNEVVVALLGKPGAEAALRRFARLLAVGTSGLLAVLALTPLGEMMFRGVYGLQPELAALAAAAILFAVPMPAYQALQSWFQGVLVHHRRTRGITEAVVLYVLTALAGLSTGVAWGGWTGILFAVCTFVTGGILQTAWLARRARSVAGSAARAGA
jgi:hypothetical protein